MSLTYEQRIECQVDPEDDTGYVVKLRRVGMKYRLEAQHKGRNKSVTSPLFGDKQIAIDWYMIFAPPVECWGKFI